MDDDDRISCATYTHARRHPLVLGHIGGWKPPFQLSVTQIVVLVVSFWLQMQTWHLWGGHLPRLPGLLVAVVIPCGLAWAVRRTRIEGRSLPRAALGWVALAWSPRGGHSSGRPCREVRAARPGLAPVYVASGDEEGAWR